MSPFPASPVAPASRALLPFILPCFSPRGSEQQHLPTPAGRGAGEAEHPACLPFLAAAKEPGQEPGAAVKAKGRGKGRQDPRAAKVKDTPPQVLCAPDSRRARGGDRHPPPGRAVPAEILRAARTRHRPRWGNPAGAPRGADGPRYPVPLRAWGCGGSRGKGTDAAGPPRSKASSAEPLNAGGGSARRRGEPPAPGSERSLAGGGEGPPASSFLPCLQLALHQGRRRRRRNPLKVSI